MKMQDRIFFKQIIKPVVVNFTSLVEGTIGKESKNSSRKIFSAAELWNIQRRRQRLLVR